jgi:hypothetical protein
MRKSLKVQPQYVPEMYTRYTQNRDIPKKITKFLTLGSVYCSVVSLKIFHFLNTLVF